MAGDEGAHPPSVIWAQRDSAILLTICLEDCKDPEIKIKPDSLSFEGVGGPDKKPHKVTINFFKEVDSEKSVYSARDRNIEFVIKKKESGPYWPTLTKEKTKYHWLKIDFNKWKAEDDSDDEGGQGGPEGGESNFDDMVKQLGALSGGGGGGGKPNLDDLNESDSDDGDLPDLE